MMGCHLRRTAGAVILIISLFMTGLAVAGPNEDAEKALEKAFESGDDTTLRALAEEGNTRAQASLGFWHIMIYLSDPDHNPVDNTEGVKWIRKSAEQGDAFGQYILGLMYIDLPEEEDFLAKVLPHDNTEAMKWIRKAADQGDSDAMYKLGVLYENGQGVRGDGSSRLQDDSRPDCRGAEVGEGVEAETGEIIQTTVLSCGKSGRGIQCVMLRITESPKDRCHSHPPGRSTRRSRSRSSSNTPAHSSRMAVNGRWDNYGLSQIHLQAAAAEKQNYCTTPTSRRKNPRGKAARGRRREGWLIRYWYCGIP
jgi:TPR repeat protein